MQLLLISVKLTDGRYDAHSATIKSMARSLSY